MPRSKASKQTTQKLTQPTLVGFLSSSPTQSSLTELSAFPTSKRMPTVKRKRAQSPDAIEEQDSDSSNVGAIHFEPENHVVSEEDEDESPRISRTQKRRKPQRHVSADSDSEQSTSRVTGSEGGGIGVTLAGNGKGDAHDIDSETDSRPLRRRKLIKGERPPTPEDENYLGDDVDEADIIETRFRSRDKKTMFQMNLEKLRRRKRGLAHSESSEEQGDDDANVAPFSGSWPDDSSHCSEEEAQEDDSFIVEDNASALGIQLPAEFSMNTYQDLGHHFKIICQFFVHLAVRSSGERKVVRAQILKGDYFSIPLSVTRRKLDGLRDSLVTSSVWRPSFKRRLDTFPVLEISSLDFAVPSCDACRLSGRMSTRLGRLCGAPYSRDTFESLESSDSESSDDGSSNKEFHLGRFCANRTQAYHNFVHWEHALYTALSWEIESIRASNSKNGFVCVSHAGGIKPPRDLLDADGIMAWLDERRIIEMEWQKVKDMMESARHLEMAAKKGQDFDG